MNLQDLHKPYEILSAEFFGQQVPRDARNIKLCSIYPEGSEYFKRCYGALLQIEFDAIQALIHGLAQQRVPGAFAEFGIFQGAWIERLHEMSAKSGLGDRKVYGFDSFQGLSAPHRDFDVEFWKEGMYAASRAEVEKNLQAHKRPRIQLIEGFFADSLLTRQAAEIGDIAFARIDCDIYEPAKQCLEYLGPRLAHGAILVFDDWTHDFEKGEGRAFAEWAVTQPQLGFEYIFLGPWDHLHLRVQHRDKERLPAIPL